jgi:predicted nucleotide-binding protein (sugar kinase/HSP70/actin superfamily)
MTKGKNKATLDTLAQMVAKGFENTATKIELKELEAKMDLGFDDLGKKIEKVDSRVDEVYEILARFEEGDILDLQKRIKILERAVKALSRQFS